MYEIKRHYLYINYTVLNVTHMKYKKILINNV